MFLHYLVKCICTVVHYSWHHADSNFLKSKLMWLSQRSDALQLLHFVCLKYALWYQLAEHLLHIIRSRLPTEGWDPGPILSHVHGRSAGLSVVGHADVLWQNGWTNQDAIWHVGLGGPQ